MKNFIVFNNIKKAKNYVKREQHKHNSSADEGCGCCYSSSYMDIEDSFVVINYCYTYRDVPANSRCVIGRIKCHQ